MIQLGQGGTIVQVLSVHLDVLLWIQAHRVRGPRRRGSTGGPRACVPVERS